MKEETEKCQNCGKEYDASLQRCPNCGCPKNDAFRRRNMKVLFWLGVLTGLVAIAFGCGSCKTADDMGCYVSDGEGGAKECECKPEWIGADGRCSVCKHKVQ